MRATTRSSRTRSEKNGSILTYDTRFEIRCSTEQLELWRKAAGGKPLMRWLRELADAEVLKLYPPQHDTSESDAMKDRQVFKKRGCPRWMYHEPGVYCPGCDTRIPG